MPLYDYDCSACGRRFEVIHGIHDGPPAQCPLCGSGPVRKAFAAPAVHFKGSGWAKKERRAAVKSSSGSKGEGSDGDATGGDGTSTSREGSKPATDTGLAKDAGAAKDAGPAKASTSSSTDTSD